LIYILNIPPNRLLLTFEKRLSDEDFVTNLEWTDGWCTTKSTFTFS